MPVLDVWREAIALHNVGTAEKVLGQQEEALRHLEQASQRFTATMQPGLLAENLRVTAGSHARRGDSQRALATYEQALTVVRSGQQAEDVELTRKLSELVTKMRAQKMGPS